MQQIDAGVGSQHNGRTHAPTPRELIGRMLGPDWRFRLHRLGRFRWLTKYRLMRAYKADVTLSSRLRYVLLDPEIESFSYDVENEAEMVAGVAAALGRPAAELASYVEEVRGDPELSRWRRTTKRRLPIGSRLPWYLIARAEKPRVVVETGIYQGLGSLTLLRALARNAAEGHPGELISFDQVADAGALVGPHLREGWHRVIGSTRETLSGALEGREVDLMFQDTPHTEENQRFEFGAILEHAAPRLVLFDCSSGESSVLHAVAKERRGFYHAVPLRSRDHIYPGSDVTFAIFDARGTRPAEEA
jgi:Methyltransferase domain